MLITSISFSIKIRSFFDSDYGIKTPLNIERLLFVDDGYKEITLGVNNRLELDGTSYI